VNPEFIFYHIPKCGGTSVRSLLYKAFITKYTHQQIYFPQTLFGDCDYKGINLTTNDDYVAAMGVLNEHLEQIKIVLCHTKNNDVVTRSDSCKSLCVLRHPVDRLISHYYYFDKVKFDNKPMRRLPAETLKKYCLSYSSLMCEYVSQSNDIDTICKDYDNITYTLILEKINDQLTEVIKNICTDFKIENKQTCKLEILNRQKNNNTTPFERQIVSEMMHNSLDMKLYQHAVTTI